MNNTLKNMLKKASVTLLASSPLVSVNLYADDIEIYTGALADGYEDQIEPNILYILDTSGSMKKSPGFVIDPLEYWEEPYDRTRTYPGPCDPNTAYRKSFDEDRNDDGVINEDDVLPEDFQSCPSEYSFSMGAVTCRRVHEQGFAVDNFGEFRPVVPGKTSHNGRDLDGKWYSIVSDFNGTNFLFGGGMHWIWRECASDAGIDGINPTASDKYPRNSETSYGWTNHPLFARDLSDRSRNLVASGNYINYFVNIQSRMAAVKIAVRDIIRELPGNTRVGLMRFDTGADKNDTTFKNSTEGGMLFHEFVRIGDGSNRQSLVDAVMTLDERTDGGTPLGETMMEATYVFAGGPVYFGNLSVDIDKNPMHSVPESRQNPTPGTEGYKYYKSPIEYSCQQNTIVYMTDGAASSDYSADNHYSAYDGFVDSRDPWERGESYYTNSTYGYVDFRGGFRFLPDADNYLIDEDGDGDIDDCDDETLNCLPKIADWLAHEDVNPTVPGTQTVNTNTIGFIPAGADDDAGTLPDPEFLQETADLGNGEFFRVTSFDELKEAFLVTTRKAVIANTAFAAPALAVNAFNRTQDGNRIYFALFKTSTTPGWGGNLKAYQFGELPDGSIGVVDATGMPAVDPDSGLFHFDAQSIWSADADGNDALLGGAASRIPATRNLYTWFEETTPASLINPDNAFSVSNANTFTDEMLGMDGTEPYTRSELIKWMSGIDPATDQPRYHMGDPLHSRPVVVTYGSSEADPDQKLFVTTNDGMLHIIDIDSGVEEFAFIAEESLGNARRMYEGDASEGKAYGLDGALQLHIDEGGEYEPGITGEDKVYLYVGMRRGGRNIYAFDMTDYDNPKILWRIQGGDVDGDGSDNDAFHYLGYTFSTPQQAELKIDGNRKKVLIFGGGYDMKQDDPDGNPGTTDDPYVADDYGNAIYIVDAETGDRLWWASSHEDANLVIPEMVNSIPSDVAVVDVDHDGWTDRLYVGDTGGRMFRIDLDEANSGYSIGATGGMIADIGGSSDVANIANNRKLFYAPDIVTVENGDDNYLAIAFGTGNRAHPSYPVAGNTEVKDKFFVLKDPHILSKPGTTPSSYDYGIRMDNGSLYDTTSNDVMSTDDSVRIPAQDAMDAAKGWYIDMANEGEKVLSAAVTLNYKIYFTSFEPQDIDLENCQARTGIGRLYTLDIRNGKPVNPNYHSTVEGDGPDTILETEDRIHELARDGIPPALTFTFPEANNGEPLPMVATEAPPANPGVNMQRSYWRTR